MLWVFVGQLILIAAWFIWNDSIPSWVNYIIAATAIIFPVIAYLTLLAQPSVRQAWRWVFREFYLFALSISPALKYWFSFRTVVNLVRLVRSLKTFPESMDGWIALCLLPFKTYIIVALPFSLVCVKVFSFFHPARRDYWELEDLLEVGYFISVVLLLPGALLQALVCRSGRASQTMFIFLLGVLILLLLMPRVVA